MFKYCITVKIHWKVYIMCANSYTLFRCCQEHLFTLGWDKLALTPPFLVSTSLFLSLFSYCFALSLSP